MLALATPVRHLNIWVQLLIAGLVVASVLAPAPSHTRGLNTAGINREVWETQIQENLFKDNEFMLSMTDESEYVNFLTVHNPQAGAAPSVTKNRAKGGGPVATNLRTDTTLDWNIDEYTSDPFLITNAEEVQLSYSKMESVLYEMQMNLNQVVADNCLINIAPTGTGTFPDSSVNANILRSTGVTNNDPGNIVSSLTYNTGATGNRLNFTLFDIRAAKKFFDKQNVPSGDRHMIMSPDAADQIVSDLIVTKYRQDAMNVFDTKTGSLDTLLGFKIHIRSTVVTYNNAATPVVKAYGAGTAATDNDAILFWQKAFVGRATGDIHVYDTPNSAVYYGDVYSTLVRHGSTKRRTSELGVGAIVQAASA